ncbi:MAG TPA: ROK family protein [Paludibacter sp.]|nr:ROK family protein [Paludibacter sp.]
MRKTMKYAIGIDLGGTFIKYALIASDGMLLCGGKLPSNADRSAEAVLEQLGLAASKCLVFATENNLQVEGIGIGTPGIVDPQNRILLGGAENIKGWSMVAVADVLEPQLNLPVKVCNDANMMGLGETAFGSAQGCSDVVFITVGTGIGGAVIIDGKLFGGYGNRGTELGHIPLIANGEQCACGSVGCWETYASTSALVRQFEQLAKSQTRVFNEPIDGKLIVSLYNKSDDMAVKIMEDHFFFIGRGIAGLINIFSPQRVVIGGGISEAGNFYFKKVAEMAFKYALPECSENTEIVAAKLGNKAGCMGAAFLFL